MALAPGTDRRPSRTRMIWDSSVGKKTVMAVSGLLMLLYLIAHMYGNLKIFFGPGTFDEYAHWLRTVGEPFMHYEWTLWVIRVVLVIAVVAHAVSAYQLSRRDQKARPVKYAHPRRRASYATHTMRYGGIVLALFIVWHILDLTTGTVHSGGFQNGHPYANVVDTFSTWYGNVIYIVAMLALGLHIQHGFYSAAQTLGVGSRSRDLVLKTLANVLAVVITLGFIAVPVGVMTGLVD
ncbi:MULTISPECIES: succinate dehydrogenase [unclassified Streptomyces]|uniref:Succinate dehydrogenase n=1 Tax=Streptomyces evansiae TaxID=3075535 RepID=A0ABD5E7G1_9ACTN|nr:MULTISPECIES: succinate dehydrogenase [unclassified Streptomyces]ASY31676.1 succinate dehydrogenase [Streptomyces sp. CLI2509]EFL03918.1 cytochrome B subunit [Streptomyces sp. SPB78]MDT0411275.1 succinate dehydrogenase [Streptomyces sp. DSM 41979]MDT0416220.1 succinate dehydrogenase [Streptomyces sp. DSM 41982]MDT0424325.1 succinate dehydrogenase [Streptomyces sp. DSM 41859]